MAGIFSMTGYGASTVELGGRAYAVEIRTVNHRYLDVKVMLPRPFLSAESAVAGAVRARLSRGRVELMVRVATPPANGASSNRAAERTIPRVTVDLALAREVYRALEELRGALGVAAPVSLDYVASVRDVVSLPEDVETDPELLAGRLTAATNEALDRVTAMRAVEGRALEKDLRSALAEARAAVAAIASAAPGRIEEHHSHLRERVERLVARLGTIPVEESRLAQELVLISDRLDVSEELARIGSHFDQMDALLAGGDAVGRKADFLIQEMGREANTIGSKSGDAELTRQVVLLKSALERLREQVQNLE